MKELDEIDRLFQASFDGFERIPDPVVKENIDRAIASKKKRRRLLLVLFPVLFLTTGLAAILYFREISKEETPTGLMSQTTRSNEIDREEKNTVLQIQPDTNKRQEQDAALRQGKLHPSESTNQQASGKNNFASTNYKQTTANRRHSIQLRPGKNASSGSESRIISGKHQPIPHNQSEESNDLNERNNMSSSVVHSQHTIQQSLPDSTDKQSKAESEIATKDSTTASPGDSVQHFPETAESTYEPLPEVKKSSINWSLAILGAWEAEQKRPFESFDATNFTGNRKEFASIHSSSFYGRLELNRKLIPRLNLVAGVGFRSTNITQYATLYTRDSIFNNDGTVSTIPTDSVTYYIHRQTGKQVYRVNSVTIPVGLSYLVPLTQKFRLRFSAGMELAYGWRTNKQLQPAFSTPRFQSFGCNLWVRPELHYDLGKIRIFGFGSVNQALSQQLRWDFNVRRNPLFGGGVGICVDL